MLSISILLLTLFNQQVQHIWLDGALICGFREFN